MIVVDVLRRSVTDRTRPALRLDQGGEVLRSQAEGPLEVAQSAKFAPAVLAVSSESIRLLRVSMPLRQRFDLVATATVLMTLRGFDALSNGPALPQLPLTICRRRTN